MFTYVVSISSALHDFLHVSLSFLNLWISNVHQIWKNLMASISSKIFFF